jgi:hypothetical protein
MMHMNSWLLALPTALLLLGRPCEGAEAIVIGGVSAAIPAPGGLVALVNRESPYYRVNAQMQQQAGNRLLAAFLPKPAAEIADSGRALDTDEWAIVFTLGRNETQVVTNNMFVRDLVPMWENALEKAMADPALRKKLDSAMDRGIEQAKREFSVEGDLSLKIGVMSPLGVYAKNQRYVAYGAGTKFRLDLPDGSSREVPVVMVLSTINVKDRLLGAAIYRKLTSRADIDIAKRKALEWSDAIVRMNP